MEIIGDVLKELYPEEIWKDVVGYEGLYKVSSFGRMLSLKRIAPSGKPIEERYIIIGKNQEGYMNTSLFKPGARNVKFKVHRLVAQAFLPNPENKLEVNHINGVKWDNRVENLEWATRSENMQHRFRVLKRVMPFTAETRLKLSLASKGRKKDKATYVMLQKEIIQLTMGGEFIKEFESIAEADRETKTNATSISQVAQGKRRSAGGFIWAYKSKYSHTSIIQTS